jgi:uncharacterized protein (TIGR02246 family)
MRLNERGEKRCPQFGGKPNDNCSLRDLRTLARSDGGICTTWPLAKHLYFAGNCESASSNWEIVVMRRFALVIAFMAGMIAPAMAQKAEIEAVNVKWMEFFNKGDFAGVASLYTDDATAFPPGSGMVKGRSAIEAMWKSAAEQISDPKVTTLDVKPLGQFAAREIGTFSLKTKGPAPQEVTGKYVVVWEKVGSDWKLAIDIWNDGK